MEKDRYRCKHCKRIRLRRRAEQQFCGEAVCQKARKNAWRRRKYETDPDYRANQRDSSNAWLASQGGSAAYHRRYRKTRQEYAACVPTASRPTDAAGANSDARKPQNGLISGRYRLSSCDSANSDAILVNLSVIPDG